MKQFQVPQFLTVEDQVIGPFTIKQAIYLGTGVVIIVFFRIFFETYIFLPLSVFIAAIALSLAFLKVQGQPFPVVLKNAFLYTVRPRLYVWKRGLAGTAKMAPEKKQKEQKTEEPAPSKMSNRRLAELAWSLDIKEKQDN